MLNDTCTAGRRLLAEFVGTALLVTAVVGSGIMATTLSPDDVGLQLLENSIATAFALGALILTFGPVSGAHFNPVVSAADWFLGRRTGTGLTGRDLGGYIAAQILGAIAGSILANLMFDLAAVDVVRPRTAPAGAPVARRGRRHRRPAPADLRAGPLRPRRASRRPRSAPTSAPRTGSPPPPASPTPPSPSAGRSPTRSPASPPPRCPAFVVAQLVGLLVGVGLLLALYPHAGQPPTTWSSRTTPPPNTPTRGHEAPSAVRGHLWRRCCLPTLPAVQALRSDGIDRRGNPSRVPITTGWTLPAASPRWPNNRCPTAPRLTPTYRRDRHVTTNEDEP